MLRAAGRTSDKGVAPAAAGDSDLNVMRRLHMHLKRVLANAATAGLLLAGLISAAAQAQAPSSMGADGGMNTPLAAMPAGHLTVAGSGQMRQLHLDAIGLTPSSTHEVDLVRGGCSDQMRMGHMRSVMSMGTIKADAGGAVDTMISAPAPAMHSHRSLLILLGTSSTGSNSSMVVACASLHKQTGGSMLHSVTQTGMPTSGQAQISYDAATQSLTVHVHATGFTPMSMHAAHIHQGSCQAQGGVLYMLQDLQADGNGVIDATRTVTGVMSAPPVSGWYLNIHMGDSQNILANGQPTLEFQPRLCGDIAGAGAAGGTTGMGAHGQVTTSNGEQFLSAGQKGQKIMTIGPFTFTADCTGTPGDAQATFNVVSSQNGSDLDGVGPVPAGRVVNIHADPTAGPGTDFAQSPSASTSTEIAPDGTEVDVFYNDGVNLDGHDCFAGAVGFTS